jgi:hypothetical protein
MTERGLPIVDGAPACPFVAFEDDRDERAPSPDHRHRCYAEPQPAPRALAHQEAYCLSSAFPVCPTFQDWARREAARSRLDVAKPVDAGPAAAGSGRNPPRNWAAPPPWLTRKGRTEGSGAGWDDDDGDADLTDDEVRADVPRRGRGLSGSYADRVASDPVAAMPRGLPDDDFEEAPPAEPASLAARPEPTAPGRRASLPLDDESDAAEEPLRTSRRREREAGRVAPPGAAPEWERAKPLEAYPTLRSRRLPELSVPPILVAVVAVALAAAVLFALPGLLGFGTPSTGASPTPGTQAQTQLPSLAPTAIPQPTETIYIVQSGDTMSRIAGRFGLTLQELIDANAENIPDPDKLQVGDRVIIPVPLATELPAASEIPAAT